MSDRLRDIARLFLDRSDTLCFLGYEESPTGNGTRPAVISDPSQSERLIWNELCYANLTSYLPRYREKEGIIGITVKGCDARALHELERSNQVDRERLVVVGLPCQGLAGPDGSSPASRCYGCRHPEDFEYDVTLGPMDLPELPPSPGDELAGLSYEERRRFWEIELEKCIRCDACRRICYGCFCPECIFESMEPRWISKRGDISEKLFFHAVRAYHLAGRCIGCDECARACPAGVRLDILNRSLQNCLEELFSFTGAGLTIEDPPLITFSRDDPEPCREGPP
jgi:ferredoxin